jgi:hypothetical protein
MKTILLSIFFLSMLSCTKTSKESIIADIKSYNQQVLKINIKNLQVIDEEASCAGKTESYVFSSSGATYWYKWDKSSLLTGGYAIRVYTLPVNMTNYKCNPELNYKSQYKAHRKENEKWVEENYQE